MPEIRRHHVSLDVQRRAARPGDGYTDTLTSTGQTYSYRYRGGDRDTGDISDPQGTMSTVQVELQGGDFRIQDIRFRDDRAGQLGRRVDEGGHTALIIDNNNVPETVEYIVHVADTRGACTFDCDPMMSTDPTPR